jgi:hypothetical protein
MHPHPQFVGIPAQRNPFEAESSLRSKELRRVAVVSIILAGLALCLGSAALAESRSRATVSSTSARDMSKLLSHSLLCCPQACNRVCLFFQFLPIDVFFALGAGFDGSR